MVADDGQREGAGAAIELSDAGNNNNNTSRNIPNPMLTPVHPAPVSSVAPEVVRNAIQGQEVINVTPQRHSQFGQVQSEVDFVDNRPLQVQPPHLAAQMPQPGMDTALKRTLRPVQLSTAASNQNLPQAPAAVDVGNFVLQAPVENVAKSAEAVVVKGNACFLPLFPSLPQSTSTFPFLEMHAISLVMDYYVHLT